MSILALSLNLLLGVLLTAALWMGWRLNRQLKALRSGQDGFAKAIADLDAAAGRAEEVLATLKIAVLETDSVIGEKIAKANELAEDLDRRTTEQTARALRPEEPVRIAPVERAERAERPLFMRPEPPTTQRSRARIDDDLFEPDEPVRLRAFPGGRR